MKISYVPPSFKYFLYFLSFPMRRFSVLSAKPKTLGLGLRLLQANNKALIALLHELPFCCFFDFSPGKYSRLLGFTRAETHHRRIIWPAPSFTPLFGDTGPERRFATISWRKDTRFVKAMNVYVTDGIPMERIYHRY